MAALRLLDEHGDSAYCCAEDGAKLARAPGTGADVGDVLVDVLVCPRCGHRTDEPGAGVLGDGFDIVHRQWGLRGDLHAWRALRELVATTPTPATADAVRAAYVEGLDRAAAVDLDGTDAEQVHRPHLDHGGMSGGSVHLGWWRTKGIPLLVDRAVGRRPVA